MMAVSGYATTTTPLLGGAGKTTKQRDTLADDARERYHLLKTWTFLLGPSCKRERPAPTLVCGMYALSIQRTRKDANLRGGSIHFARMRHRQQHHVHLS